MTTRRVRLARPHQLAPVTMLKRDLNPRVAAPSPPGNGPSTATHEDVPLRLALWLADVAAETTLAATAPGVAARRLGRADEPPVVEPAR